MYSGLKLRTLLLLFVTLTMCIPTCFAKARNQTTSQMEVSEPWKIICPVKMNFATKESGTLCADGSIQFSHPSPSWSEGELIFRWNQPRRITHIRLELMPSLLDPKGSFGRRGGELLLFDVRFQLVEKKKRQNVRAASVWNPADVMDETVFAAHDALSESGWSVTKAKNRDGIAVLCLQLERPIEVHDSNAFHITIDSGGSQNLDTIGRVRVSVASTARK